MNVTARDRFKMSGSRVFARERGGHFATVPMVALVLAAAVALLGTLAALKSPFVIAALTQTALGRALGKDAGARVSVARVRYAFPDDWTLYDVHGAAVLRQGPVSFSAAEVRLTKGLSFFHNDHAAGILFNGAHFSTGKLRVDNAEGALQVMRSGGNVRYDGRVVLGKVGLEKVVVTAVRASVSGDMTAVAARDMTFSFCGGLVRGTARAGFQEPFSYETALEVNGVQPLPLAAAAGGIFNEIGGVLSGQFRLTGRGALVDGLETGWNMPSGGKISAVLLSSLLSYIPPTREKKHLEALVASGGKLAVEIFSFTIKNDAPDHFSGEIGIRSRAVNLELNITHDVKVDGRIDAILKAWKTIFRS